MAHLHLGLWAYWLSTIHYQLKQSVITDVWKEIKRKATAQISVITTARNSYYKIIQIIDVLNHLKALVRYIDALKGLKTKPFKQIKFVVHKLPPKKNETHSTAQFLFG